MVALGVEKEARKKKEEQQQEAEEAEAEEEEEEKNMHSTSILLHPQKTSELYPRPTGQRLRPKGPITCTLYCKKSHRHLILRTRRMERSKEGFLRESNKCLLLHLRPASYACIFMYRKVLRYCTYPVVLVPAFPFAFCATDCTCSK